MLISSRFPNRCHGFGFLCFNLLNKYVLAVSKKVKLRLLSENSKEFEILWEI